MSNPNNESKVEIVAAEALIRSQYGKGFVYANNKKHPAWMWIAGLILSSTLIFPLFIAGPPTKKQVEGIDTPNLDSSRNSNITIPFYSAEQAQNDRQENIRSSNAHLIIRYSGMQSVDKDFKFDIPPGTEAKAKIVGAITNNVVRAELIEDLKSDGRTFFRSGTLFIGQGSTADDRLQISFNNVSIDKKRISIQAQALDANDRNVGVRGPRFSYYSKKLGVAVGLNFISAATEVLQSRDSSGFNVVKRPTVENALLGGVSQTAADLSKTEADRAKRGSEIVRLAPGTEIIIVF